MAKTRPVNPLRPIKPLTDLERRLVEFYANPANVATYGKKRESALAAGYTQTTATTGMGRVFKKPHFIQAVNETLSRMGGFVPVVDAEVVDVPGSGTGGDSIRSEVETHLMRMIRADPREAFQQIAYEVTGANGEVQKVYRMELQDLTRLPKGIIKAIKYTNSTRGQVVDVQFHDTLAAMTLLGKMRGWFSEDKSSRTTVIVNQNFSAPYIPDRKLPPPSSHGGENNA